MNDPITENAYLKKLDAQERARRKAEADALRAEYAQPEPAAQPAQAAAPAVTPAKEGPGFLPEAGRAVAGAVVDAATGVWNTVDQAATWLDNNVLDLRIGSDTFGTRGGRNAAGKPEIAATAQVDSKAIIAENQTTGGKVARSITAFLVPYGAIMKGLKAVGLGAKTGKGLAAQSAGASTAVAFAAADPYEERLSNLIADHAEQGGYLHTVADALAAKDADGPWEARMKAAVEDIGMGAAAEAVIAGVKTLRGLKAAKGEKSLQDEVSKVLDRQKAAEAPTKPKAAPEAKKDLSLLGQVEVLTGVRAKPTAAQSAARKRELEQTFNNPKADQLTATAGVPMGTGRAADEALPKATGDGIRLEDPDAIPFTRDVPPAEAPKAPDDWTLQPLEKRVADVTEAMTKSPAKAHSALWDAESESLVFTLNPPTPTQLPIEQQVGAIMAKRPLEWTTAERKMLQEYNKLQHAAAPELVTDLKGAASPTDPAAIEVVKGVGSGARKSARNAPDVPKSENTLPEELYKVGDVVEYGSGKGTGEIVERLKDGRVMVIDTATGIKKPVTPDRDEVYEAVLLGNRKLAQGQSGFASGALLAQMASAMGGGAAGFALAGDDATLEDRLYGALGGAAAGAGILAGAKVGARRLLSKEQVEATKAAAKADPVLRELADPLHANIKPMRDGTVKETFKKSLPKLDATKARELADAIQAGDAGSLASKLDESDFNFDYISDADDIRELVDSVSTAFSSSINAAKDGTKTFDQLKQLAAEVAGEPDVLVKAFQDTDNLAARVMASRAVMAGSAKRVMELAKAAQDGSVTSMLAFRKQVLVHSTIQAQMKGVQTEVARALASFRIMSGSVDMSKMEMDGLIEAMGGVQANRDFAAKLQEITSPSKLAKVLEKSALARTEDALFEAWRAGLLSGPATQVANIAGNMLVAITSPVERAFGAGIGALRRDPDAIQMREVSAQLFGMAQGMVDALRMTSEGWRTLGAAGGQFVKGDYRGAMGTIEAREATLPAAVKGLFLDDAGPVGARKGVLEGGMPDMPGAISSENFKLNPGSFLGKGVDMLGAVVRTPYRGLASMDTLFQSMHYSGEIAAQAYRRAHAGGLTGEALAKRIQELHMNPEPDMVKAAYDTAVVNTFQEPMGLMGTAILNAGDSSKAFSPLVKVLMPFVRTPINILKYIGRRTPGLARASEMHKAAIAAGGREKAMAEGRLAMGSSLLLAGGMFASMGMITGGGEKKLESERLAGWQQYSIKIGDTYYSFNRADPVMSFFGIAADLADIAGHLPESDVSEVLGSAALAITNNVLSKTWMQGVSETISALATGDGERIQKHFRGMAGSMVPFSGAVRSVRKEDDEAMREVFDWIDSIKNTIPGLSKTLPPMVNILGDDMIYRGGLGPDIASPFTASVENPSPAAKAMAELNLDVQRLPRSITASGAPGAPTIDLTPEQYYRYQKLAGNEYKIGGKGFKEWADEFVQSEQYQRLMPVADSDYMDSREHRLKVMLSRYRTAAKAQLIREFPDLQQKVALTQKNARNVLRGIADTPIE